jgi:CHASE3 domain sensor protein
MTKSELNQQVATLRSLKALKEETEQEIREIEKTIIDFLNETEECEATDKNGKPIRQYIGTDYKATYSMQTRENLNKEAVKNLLNAEQFASVTSESTFGVLRIR